jgi:hypothetical protein
VNARRRLSVTQAAVLTFRQSRQSPDRYGASRRLLTTLQAPSKIGPVACLVCCFYQTKMK